MKDNSIQNSQSGFGPILIVFAVWTAIVGLSVAVYRPVVPLGKSTSANQFSAARADDILKTLVGDSIPHPAGSPQNAIVRGRIVSLLESFGYDVEIQSGTGHVNRKVKDRSPDKDTVKLHNIIARRKGTNPGPALMLASHYDSVPFGPGASDDGVGTAALLEIARMLASEPDPKREVVFLITDGEEFGLLGAKLFVDQHPLAKQIALAINLEARGTTGPSLMFQTSRLSRKLIPVFARATRKPMASSLFFEIYKRTPRDTDFTAFSGDGMLGYNFAYIGDVKNYHSPADSYQNVDLGSLQHHGENALGLIRELLAMDGLEELLNERPINDADNAMTRDEAVYFDMFGRWLIWWPSAWSTWFCGVAAIMFLMSAVKFRQFQTTAQEPHSPLGIADQAKHVGAQLCVIVAIFGIGYLIQFLVQRDPRMSNPWPRQPVPILIGFWSASFAIAGGWSIAFAKWLDPRATWNAFCVLWLIFAAASSILLNGASYLFVVPILATTSAAVAAARFGKQGQIAAVVMAAIFVGLIWLPLERLFYDAVGFRMPMAMATLIRMAMLGMTLLGILSVSHVRARFVFAITSVVISVGAFASAIALNSEF